MDDEGLPLHHAHLGRAAERPLHRRGDALAEIAPFENLHLRVDHGRRHAAVAEPHGERLRHAGTGGSGRLSRSVGDPRGENQERKERRHRELLEGKKR